MTLVPGGPSAGEIPVTTGGGLIFGVTLFSVNKRNYFSNFHPTAFAAMFATRDWALRGPQKRARLGARIVNEETSARLNNWVFFFSFLVFGELS